MRGHSDWRWFREAITGDDNLTISPTFLAVAWAVFVVLPLVICALVGISVVDVVLNKHEASVGALGGGIAAVITSVGAFITGMAVLLAQDKKPSAPTQTTTTTTTIGSPSATIGAVAADPLKVAVVDMPPEDKKDKPRARKKGRA